MTHSDARARPRERLRPDAETHPPTVREAARKSRVSREHVAYRAAPRTKRKTARKPSFSRLLAQSIVALGVLIWGVFGGADQLLTWQNRSASRTLQLEASARAPNIAAPWIVDIDGDGKGDFANPSDGFVRGEDAFGSGQFEAGRDAGKRVHHGLDIVTAPGTLVRAPITGVVTKMGAAYHDSEKLRFVELTNETTKLSARVFYVNASIGIGDQVAAGAPIGVAQDLQARYPGITNHVHVELRDGGKLLDPSNYLPFYPGEAIRAALPSPVRS